MLFIFFYWFTYQKFCIASCIASVHDRLESYTERECYWGRLIIVRNSEDKCETVCGELSYSL